MAGSLALTPGAIDRFLAKVERRGLDECWPWAAGKSDTGYGAFRIGDKVVGSHRVAYLIEHGVLPDHADHDCHNGSSCPGGKTCTHRACCNPAHIVDRSSAANTLLGNGPSAVHARKDRCDSGHEFTVDNTYCPPGGRPRRICRECVRNRQAGTRERKAA